MFSVETNRSKSKEIIPKSMLAELLVGSNTAEKVKLAVMLSPSEFCIVTAVGSMVFLLIVSEKFNCNRARLRSNINEYKTGATSSGINMEAGRAFSLDIGCKKFPELSDTVPGIMEMNVLFGSAPNMRRALTPFKSSSENCMNTDIPSPVL